MIEDIEVTQTCYDCEGMATQIFLQGRWINSTALFEMEDSQVVYLNYVSPTKLIRFLLFQPLKSIILRSIGPAPYVPDRSFCSADLNFAACLVSSSRAIRP